MAGWAYGKNGRDWKCIQSFGGETLGKCPLGCLRRRWRGDINKDVGEDWSLIGTGLRLCPGLGINIVEPLGSATTMLFMIFLYEFGKL
jgi:hypothetical protein